MLAEGRGETPGREDRSSPGTHHDQILGVETAWVSGLAGARMASNRVWIERLPGVPSMRGREDGELLKCPARRTRNGCTESAPDCGVLTFSWKA